MRARRAWPLAVLAGTASGATIGGWAAVPVAAAVTITMGLALRRMESPAARRERARAAADLPMAADLLAAALRAGVPSGAAALAVGEALSGPVGDRLVAVGRALRAGLPPAQAWSRLADVPNAGRLVRAAVRSADSGAALTGALERLADDLRADRTAAAEAAARRVGVLAVLPLGLCFLPAFLLTGVVPVVAAVLGDVLRI